MKANAIVTRGGEFYNDTEMSAYTNLFIYAQQFYGRKELDVFTFSMFYSYPPYHDLIFQDATRQLQLIPEEKREYEAYLGSNFMRARRITDCDSKAPNQMPLNVPLFVVTLLVLVGHLFWAH